MNAMPSLFVSHGAPTLALNPGKTGVALADLGQRLPRPKAILVLSAHWDSARPLVSAATLPETIHDFGGFPRALYQMTYPAPGAPDLAKRVLGLLAHAGLAPESDPRRGLDHGAWVPLRYLYPAADVPVTQLSIQARQDPRYHYALGQGLRPLAQEGVLVLGSGAMTHNLGEVRFDQAARASEPYVEAFRHWFLDRLAAGDLDSLLDYRRLAPEARRAHPSDEHLLPLFAALGAGGGEARVERVVDEITYGVLAMDSYLFFGASAAAGVK